MADVRYTVTDLGILPGFVGSSAKAINDVGQVIGSVWAKFAGDRHAFWWEDSQMQYVGKVELNGINNRGEAVGTKFKHGFVLILSSLHAIHFQAGSIISLFVKNPLINEAQDINEHSQVVGHTTTPLQKIRTSADAKSDGFIWRDGERRDLPLPPGYRLSKASAINNQGIAVGTARGAQQEQGGRIMEQAVLWERDEVTLLGALPGFEESQSVAINNRRQVLVRAISHTHQADGLPLNIGFRHFLWDDGHKQEIEGRSVRALNDHGQAVGSDGWVDFNTEIGRLWAFLWQHREVFDLNSLIPPNSGWELTHANGINNHGQIVGSGFHNGKERAFLLTPINQIKEQSG